MFPVSISRGIRVLFDVTLSIALLQACYIKYEFLYLYFADLSVHIRGWFLFQSYTGKLLSSTVEHSLIILLLAYQKLKKTNKFANLL